jgi:uncharacterized protein YodC (DUF2158 family)
MIMKHKVGDTVKIKSIDWFNAQEKDSDGDIHTYSVNNIVYFTKDMSNYCSKEAKIEDIRIDDNIYFLDVDKRCYEWTDEMLDENYDFKQLAVGETFDFKGHKLRVEKVQKTSSCENCFFEKLRLSNVYACDEVFKGIIIPSCCIYQRNDNNRVIFKEVTDMEERTIKLDIETARKWYNGEDESLKTLALQAFSEDELKTHVKVWEDLFNAPKNYKGFCVKSNSNLEGRVILSDSDKCVFVDEKHAKSALAMAQISQLLPYYTEPIVRNESNWVIIADEFGDLITQQYDYKSNPNILRFKTKEKAYEFLNNNEQLVKDYFMIN